MKKFICEKCGVVESALIDGYDIRERELEGVMFITTLKNGKFFCDGVMPEFQKYFSDFNQKKICKEVVEFCKENDIWKCSKCGGETWTED